LEWCLPLFVFKKIVIAPERWNLAVDNDDAIYLEDWIKISTL
jgi:hypothetical protein